MEYTFIDSNKVEQTKKAARMMKALHVIRTLQRKTDRGLKKNKENVSSMQQMSLLKFYKV